MINFLAGADFVQLYTGMVFKGPNVAGIIKKDLKELLIRDGVKNYTEIVGNKTLILNLLNLTLSISDLI
jgi:dihydroorotate dehydrogenase